MMRCLVIDLFSRKVFTEPLETKSKVNVLAAIKRVFEAGQAPEVLETDSGTEFTSLRQDLKEVGAVGKLVCGQVGKALPQSPGLAKLGSSN